MKTHLRPPRPLLSLLLLAMLVATGWSGLPVESGAQAVVPAADTETPTATATATATATPTPTSTLTPTATATTSEPPTWTPLPTRTATPTPSATPTIFPGVILSEYATSPRTVVAGDPFDLFAVVRNYGTAELENLAVTFIIEVTTGLSLLSNTNVIYIARLRPNEQATAAVSLRYLPEVKGAQFIPIVVDYFYWYGDQRLSGTWRTSVSIAVSAPTPTPTATHTPTPTLTPTPTQTPTPTPTPTPTATSTPSSTPITPIPGPLTPSSDVGGTPAAGDTGGGASAVKPLVLLESYRPVRVPWQPQLPFDLTVSLINVGYDDAYYVTVLLESDQLLPVDPVMDRGRGQVWYFGVISAFAPETRTASFLLVEGAAGGLLKIPVRISYTGKDGKGGVQQELITLFIEPARATPGAGETSRPEPAVGPSETAAPPSPSPALPPSLTPSPQPAPSAVLTATPSATPPPEVPFWLRLLRILFGGGTQP